MKKKKKVKMPVSSGTLSESIICRAVCVKSFTFGTIGGVTCGY